MFVPQFMNKPQQNFEFPKYHIVPPPPTPTNSGHFWRAPLVNIPGLGCRFQVGTLLRWGPGATPSTLSAALSETADSNEKR
jgi:hypothetical protein